MIRIIGILIIGVILITALLFANSKMRTGQPREVLKKSPERVDAPQVSNKPPEPLQNKIENIVSEENVDIDADYESIVNGSVDSDNVITDSDSSDTKITVKENIDEKGTGKESPDKSTNETETVISTPEFFEPDVVPSIVNGEKKPKTKMEKLVFGAVVQYGITNSYNGAYQKLSYPNGDVDLSTGVCTDVVIRAFRSVNVDLQKEIHKDMSRNFRKYPRNWGLKSTDRNIDHRRVPNMEAYFTRKGYKVPIGTSTDKEHYQSGDLVVWRISGKLTHIGIVSDEIVPNTSRYFIIHNPVQGVEISDWLDGGFEIINHFRPFD